MEPEIRRLLATHLPEYRVRSVAHLGAGLENVAYEVNGELVVRFRHEPGRVEREARLLAAVGRLSPVPVPAPLFVAPEARALAYRKLPGVPLIDVPAERRAPEAVGRALGGLLAALHDAPVEPLAALVHPDDFPLADWLGDAARQYEEVAGAIPPRHRPAVEAFLGAPPPPEPAQPPVFSHNDLGSEHVLVVNGAVSGVIDWSDAAIVDRAYDLGLILRDLGPVALDAALAAYGRGGGIRDRAAFYARCGLIEDLAYGLESGKRRYVDKSLAALAPLFGTGSYSPWRWASRTRR